ncbi:MAG: uroporphyrinogen decarboxylase family protein [Candidatus Hermodarchaeota archaeon]
MNEEEIERLCELRKQRYIDALEMKEPDRVPYAPRGTLYAAIQNGMTVKEANYNPEKMYEAALKILPQYEWDLASSGILGLQSGPIMDLLEVKTLKWAGAKNPEFQLPDNSTVQYIEGEYMKAEDYKEILADPTHFIIRKVLPNLCGVFKPFNQFPNFAGLQLLNGLMGIPMWVMNPEVMKLVEKIGEVRQLMEKSRQVSMKYLDEMKKLGFPSLNMRRAAFSFAPFDMIGDQLRGLRGVMLDMYQRPEDLKALIEMFIEPLSEIVSPESVSRPQEITPMVFMPLHRGADGFMSDEQFAEFYWPSLAKVMDNFIKKGYIATPFIEGSYNDRLDYLEEFAKSHKGKVCYMFDRTDIIKVKERMGDYAIIRGNIPATLFIAGTPTQMEDYVKKILEGCKEGGGYILDGGVGLPERSKHENVMAVTKALEKYGYSRK